MSSRGSAGLLLWCAPGVVQDVPPGDDARSAAQQCTAFAFGHASPHTPFDAVVECLHAKHQAQRTKQGSSVYYTAVGASEPAAASESAAQSDESK
jgi:hypothetical protein